MARILDLPNELLINIIKSTSPVDGLEELTLSCKLFYQLGESTLHKHRSLKRSYSTLIFEAGDQYSDSVPRDVALLLCDFIDDNYAAQHVQEVAVQDCIDDRASREAHEAKIAVLAAHKSEIDALVDECDYLSSEDKPRWKKDISVGDTETAVGLAITMLPNLRRITLANSDEMPSPLFKIIRTIAEAHQQRPMATHPLQELRHVVMDRSDMEAAGWVTTFKSFAGLPSLEKLSAELIEGSPTTWNLDPCSRLRSLEFSRASIDLPSLENFLSATSVLQNFTYLYQDNNEYSYQDELPPVEWEPRKLAKSLLRFSKHSLVSLHLSSEATHPDDPHPHDGYIGPLLEFECLNTITLPFKMLIEKTGTREANVLVVHPLKDILPPSTKTIRIAGGCDRFTAHRLLAGLPQARKTSLPNLDTIVFEKNLRPHEVHIKSKEKAFESMGVKLLVEDSPEPENLHRSYVHRAFN